MPTLTNLSGLTIITPDPIGNAGRAINDNFKALANTIPLFSYKLQWNDLPLFDFLTIPTGRTVTGFSVIVTQAFNGTGAVIRIGTVGIPPLFFDVGETDLSAVDVEFEKSFNVNGPLTVRYDMTPGAGASTGKLLFRVTTTATP